MRLRFLIPILSTALVPSFAHAASCEDSFTKTGSPISGIKYHAAITVDGVTPQNALKQFRGAASAKGFDILADESASGTLLIEKPKTFGSPEEKTFVRAVPAGAGSTVTMDTKLKSGTFSSGKEVLVEYCGLLNSIRGGQAGIAAARLGQNSVSAAPPRTVDAALLTQEIAEEGEKNSAAVNARYQGKPFIIKGYLDRISTIVGTTRVYFKTPRTTNELVFHSGNFRRLPSISCAVAPGQSAYVLSLDAGARIKMQGIFDKYDHLSSRFLLKDCVAAQ
jgi:hypothetical protein